jgi:phage/plasmid-like protein (TIGR03299 family)
MSANINKNKKTGEYSFYDKKEVPWWNLGYKPQGEKTSSEVLEAAHLTWQVQKLPKFIQYPLDSNYLDEKGIRLRGILSPNDKALVRIDTGQQLGNCTDRYEILNNIDAFSFIDNIVGEKLAIYETAGALGNGEVVFVTAKLPSFIKPTNNNNDIIEKYILFTTTHDGSGSVRAMFTPIRVVCNNTLNMALNNCSGRVSMRHTKNLQDKIKDAQKIMQLYINYDSKLQFDLARMIKRTITDKEVDWVLANTFLTSEQLATFNINGNILLSRDFPVKTTNKITVVRNYIEEGPGQEYSQGTAYWLYNGITSYLNNGEYYNNNEDRFTSLIEGNEYKISQKAYNVINNLILS